VTFRPEFIDRAAVLTGTAPDQVEIPLEILSDDRWADVRVKSVTSTFPTKVYYNPTVPLGQLWVWPIPTVTTNQIVLYLPTPLLRVAGLSVDLVLPPAYEEAIRYNLALRLCPPFGRPATPDLVQFATDALGAIKRTNIKLDELKCDPALTNAGQVWNFFTGGM
jgi:hypothetical protein